MRLLRGVLVLGTQTILLVIFVKTDPYSDIVLHMPGNYNNEMHIATRHQIGVCHSETQWNGLRRSRGDCGDKGAIASIKDGDFGYRSADQERLE